MRNNCKSETKYFSHGVPQKSILGPLFFIVFTNNIFRASKLLFMIIFADENNVVNEGPNHNNIIFTLNTELQKLDVWLEAKKFTVITAKTHYMVFHPAKIKYKLKKCYEKQ